MATAKKRLTLDIDPNLQRRLKAAAALKGITMRQFCESPLFEECRSIKIPEEASEQERRRKSRLQDSMFIALRNRETHLAATSLPGNSADIIREERELRAEQIDNANLDEFVVVDASLAVKWLIPDEDYLDLARVVGPFLGRSWNSASAPPYLMPYEVSNALYRRVVGPGASLSTWPVNSR